MTIQSPVARNDYIGNGAVDVYSYTFRILAASNLLVTKHDTAADPAVLPVELVLNTDYTVTGVGALNGGTITLLAGDLPNGWALTIRRVVPVTQNTDIKNQDDFYAVIHEDTFDYITMILQQVTDTLARTLHFQETSLIRDISITDVIADAVLLSDATGTYLTWVDKEFFRGPQGEVGPEGPAGPEGLASRWYVQAGAPSDATGVDDDMSLNSSNGDVYRKGAVTPGIWALEANIAGPVGPTGFGTLNPVDIDPVGGAATVDWGDGNFQTIDLDSATGDVTLTLDSPPVTPARFTLFIRQSTTPRNVIWPANVLFPQGQAPILSQVSNAVDKVELLWDTTNYYGDWNNDYLTT